MEILQQSSVMPWKSSYPPGVEGAITLELYQTVLQLEGESTARYAKQTAYVCNEEELSFRGLQDQSANFCRFLGDTLKLLKGERVALLLPNCLAFPPCVLGILRTGGTLVSINPQYTTRELAYQLADSGARILVAHASASITPELLTQTAVKHVLVLGSREGEEPWPGVHAVTLKTAFEHQARTAWKPPALIQDDVALLQYTGGTTGPSKGAVLTHGNLLASILQMRSVLGGAIVLGQETVLTALPLYHIFGLTMNLLTFLSFGARNVLIADPRDAEAFKAALAGEEITIVTGVNTLFTRLLTFPESEVKLSAVKLAVGGGSAIQRATSDAWRTRTGRHIVQAYGLSETTCIVTVSPWTDPNFTGSVGIPVPSADVRIIGDSGTVLLSGQEGEICVKGPQVTKRYWNNAQTTAAAFTDNGFFRTGDIGTMDDRGFVRICDRKKDMVLVSGFNVYPNEVEAIIAEVPNVLECAVTGIADEKTGECVIAFVVSENASLDEGQILLHCRKNLAAYKVPKQIIFVESLPKTAVGKILRRELRIPPEAPLPSPRSQLEKSERSVPNGTERKHQ